MLRNHLKIAVRNLIRQRGYSAINVFGLAVGLTVCLLVAAYIVHEFSFETCHSKRDRIYRLQVDLETEHMGTFELAGAAPPMGPALREACPDVEAIARFRRMNGVKMVAGTAVQKDKEILVVEPEFFQVFDVEVLRGNPVVDLASPSTIYLTERLAHGLFGRADPIGQTILAGEQRIELRVAGVLKDFPTNTSMNCDALASYSSLEAFGRDVSSWSAIWQDYLYVLLRPGAEAASLEAVIPSVASQHLNEEQRSEQTYVVQPLNDIYFNPRPSNELYPVGDPTQILLFSAIALVTLVIACVNFINHTTARTAHRIKELSLRKVVGASRRQVVRQLLVEAFLIAVVSMFVAIAAFELSEPVIGMFIERQLNVGILSQPQMLAAVVGLALLVGLAAGLYPALYLSRIRPLQFLNVGAGFASRKSLTRRVLVVFQFTAAVVLATVSLVVFRQMQFSRSWDKGFDDRNIVVLEIEGDQGAALAGPLRDAMMREPGVLAASTCDLVPGLREIRGSFLRPAETPDCDPVLIRMFCVDQHFASTLGLDLVEGRHLGIEDEHSEGRNILLEQRAAKELGLEQPLGTRLRDEDEEYTVVGVMKNIHAVPTYYQGWPIMMYVRSDVFRYVLVKLDPTAPAATIDRIKAVWDRMVSAQPFEYTYLDELINSQYGDHEKFGALLGTFSAIAIFIACLGIFSLASYATERRRREIGIRKVVGATVGSIVRLLSNEFVALIMVANLVAWPIAWYLAGKWLDKFVHHIDVEPVLFVLAGFLALAVALLSVSLQALRAARANPAEALRYE